MKKVKLKNSTETALVDDHVMQALKDDPALKRIGFMDIVSLHSAGYAWAQKKLSKKRDGRKENVAVYLHKWVAEHFIPEPISDYKNVVTFKDGNRLNCTIENLVWSNRSKLTASQHYKNKKA